MTPLRLLDEKRLIICVGSGGVGKTSTAAVMGLRAAMRGRRVIVLTIDPARRLANSLGLQEFGNHPVKIDLSSLGAPGELWALMLDTQSTFDDLMGKVAPDEETRDRILSNAVYRTLSNTFASSQEYMAAEKLYDLVGNSDYDLVVLDTPPVKNALDFLEAPGRLSRFFDKRIIHWFLSPYNERRIFSAVKMGTSAVVFRLLSYVFGREFLDQLSEFLLLFKDMYEVFQSRHEAVLKIFKSASTSFVTVCAPNAPSIEVALYFAEELRARSYPRGGVIVNQVTLCGAEPQNARALLGAVAESLGEDLAPGVRTSVIARLGAAHGRYRELAAIQRARVNEIRNEMRPGDGFLVEVPRFEQEVHDLRGLSEMGDALFGEPAPEDPEKNLSSTSTAGS